ncbi:MAG TPA: universal stress protein [Actinomycetota bacterium]|nr:universal stress protein [Actinomycetota bacterium]
MFERVLVAVDGSEPSRRAAEAAAELAAKVGAEVAVLHVLETDVDVETPAEAAALVEATVASFRDRGVRAEGEVARARIGQVPRVVVETARRRGADAIVMGSRGLSEWGGLFLGSVTHRVLHLAEVPVLVVR